MKIALSCSMKYQTVIETVVQRLELLGHVPLFPNLSESDGLAERVNTLEGKKELAMEHYQAMDEADILYFITPGGYMGTSGKIELGYAVANGKPIFFSEPTNDPALDCYVKGFVSTDALETLKEQVI